MATEIGFRIKLIPTSGNLDTASIEEIQQICAFAKNDCKLEGLHGKYWFELRKLSECLSIDLYGYYTGDEKTKEEALENVLEITWQDEDNAPIIIEKYFSGIKDKYRVEIIRNFWD